MGSEAPRMDSTQSSSTTTGTGSPINVQRIIQQITDLVKQPKEAWAKISAEALPVGTIYKEYLIPLAGLAALCSFIGLKVIGISAGPVSFRIGFFAALFHALIQFGASLLMPLIGAIVAEKIAPSFGGSTDRARAFRLVAYSMMPSLAAGMLAIVPSMILGLISLCVALYSLYIFFQGISAMTGVPNEKKGVYGAVTIVSLIIVQVIVGIMVSTIAPTRIDFDPQTQAEYQKIQQLLNVDELKKNLKELEQSLPDAK